MNHITRWTAMLLTAAVLLGAGSACASNSGEGTGSVQGQKTPVSSGAADPKIPAALDLTDATAITLTGSGAAVQGEGAKADGGIVTITAAGVYAVSGSSENGRIIVNAPKEEVTVVLNGADITCPYGSPLYIYKAGTATVHLMEGTENALTDGSGYTFADDYSSAADEEPNACLYSKADLVIEGAGKLTVTANYDNGITSKDTLKITGSTISVTAVDNGINGKDSNAIDGASVTVTCGGDAIRSTNDTDGTLGWVAVSGSTLNLTAGEDGIQAETALTLTSGTYTLDCSDDAIHSNGDLTVSGGSYTVSAGDDAFHAGGTLTVSDGEINILTSYEGLEGTAVKISGGTIHVTATDDGVNAAGGMDGSGFGGFGPRDGFGGGNPDSNISISGGYLVVRAGGDGLDSNGSAAMSGGTVIVSSTGQGDSALDYESSFTLSGGTLLAAGSGNMAQAPSEASQYTVFFGFDSPLPAGTYVSLADGDQSFVWELPDSVDSIVFSSPELKGGAAYTISYGGDYSGQSVDGICSGGIYSGGTDLTVLTLSDYITTYGNRSMGGWGGRPGGNMGGRPDGNMENKPWGDRGGLPPDGEAPENGGGMPPERGTGRGEMPKDGDRQQV